MKRLTKLAEWQALAEHHDEIVNARMSEWFDQDDDRFSKLSLQVGDLFLDYSRNHITEKTLSLLFALADAVALPQKIQSLFNGESINVTEARPALHTALRDKNSSSILVNGQNIAPLITHLQAKMNDFVTQIHTKTWKGSTGKPIQHIVNLGIGGSYLGPLMTTVALKDFNVSQLNCHFISTVDEAHLNDVLKQIDPETTLFIISSKSFTTLETLTNAKTVATWLKQRLGKQDISKHFVAITANEQRAIQFGISQEHIFPLWDWVGGRYSIWSAIALPLALMIGNANFAEFLQGAYEMDQHFRHAAYTENLPIILALLNIWYSNFFGAKACAIAPYSYQLRYLVPYLQQLEMESNGKCVTLQGSPVDYSTAPVIFGAEGCNGQHTYHQLLHQGAYFVPVDFILIAEQVNASSEHQDILIASGLSQAQALMRGKSYQEAHDEMLSLKYSQKEADFLASHRMIPGNRPSNIFFLDKITPKNLGALLALYEHKVFVQGVIWDINSFDQWGVELGKQLLPDILSCLQGRTPNINIDGATKGLIARYKHFRK